MSRELRASLLAALREIYDGAWTRHLGTDGGRKISWSGKLAFLGGVLSMRITLSLLPWGNDFSFAG
jgi:hypothetical protein